MEKNFGCFFYLKKKHKHEVGEICIYLRITADSSCVEISTKRKCFTQSWNQKAGRAEGKTDYAKSINSFLDTLQQKVFEAKRQLIELDQEVIPTRIKDLMLGKKINKECYMVMEQFKQHNEQMKALVGKDYSASTMNDHVASCRGIEYKIQQTHKIQTATPQQAARNSFD